MSNLAKKQNDDFSVEAGESVNLPFQLIPNISVFTLKAYILEKVDTGQYKDAIDTLMQHLETNYVYENYKDKVQNSVLLSIELIKSIENNNNFPGLSLIPKAKRQEIRDKNVKMREDLKKILEGVVNTYKGIKSHDDRSTVYVVRTIWFSILFVSLLFMFVDMNNEHFGNQLLRAADAAATWATEKVVKLF